MRGRVGDVYILPTSGGITPARAGKRRRHRHESGRSEDHPRACGEEAPGSSRPPALLGSPPRVRGRESLSAVSTPTRGITPARAGKSQHRIRSGQGQRDHPRACGEEKRPQGLSAGAAGSPPRVRGRAPAPRWSLVRWRITPARAGKSLIP